MPALGPAIAGLFSAFSASGIGTFLTKTFLGRLLTTVALTALSQHLARQQMRRTVQPGIKTEVSTSGETIAQGAVLGWYATAGHMLCPPMTHGAAGGVQNAYLTYVLALSDLPGCTLDHVLVNDEVITLDGTAEAAGFPATGTHAGKLWVQYWDGTQTAADPWLISTYGAGTAHATDTGRPWSADMVGPGVCYLVVTFLYDRELFNSLPKVVAVLNGIPLYDPRKDSSVGGSGTHRWATPSTWEPTRNPMVMTYAIKRGIAVPGGGTWGLGVAADDLPLSNWFAAMNACDAVVDGAPAYQAGIEVSFGDEPADVIEELLKVCSGQLAEIGGIWKASAGAPGLPVYYFSDDDMIISEGNTFTPFGSLSQTFNGVQGTYPDPDALWQSKDAPPRHDAALEATDQGRVLTASLTFSACPYPAQVQRLMLAYLNDERRFRRHSLVLPPDAAILEPLDVVSWSSTANGYTAKSFEITEIGDDLGTMLQRIAMRERDPADYDWVPGFALPYDVSPVTPVRPAPLVPSGFAAAGIAILDATSRARRAAIRLDWTGTVLTGLTGVRWEIRHAGVADVIERGSMADATALTVTVTGAVLPSTDYQARIGFLAPGMAVDWTSWAAVTTPAIVITADDFDTTAPAVPTGLALSSLLADGGAALLAAEWTASGEADLAWYEVRIRQGTGNHVSAQTAINRQEWTVPRGTLFYVSLRAADRLGNVSAWSSEVSHTTATDTVAPAVPTGLAVTAGFEVLWLNWTANTDADFSHYGVYESTTTTAPAVGAAPTFVTAANALARTGLAAGVTRHYWIRGYDTSGNKSAWSARVPGTTAALTAPDISGIIDATSFASNIEPITIVPGAVLPTVKSTTTIVFQSKLYRWNGTAYVATVASTDMTGTLTDAQIAALAAAKITGQIVGTQIADGVLTAAKFVSSVKPIETVGTLPGTPHVAGRTVFLTTDNKLYRNTGTGWTATVASTDMTGQITAAQIAALAVTADKIAAGTITAAQIAAGTITGTQIAVNTITASKLVLTDRENLVPDGNFEEADASAFTVPTTSGLISFTTDSRSGGKSLKLSKSVLTDSTYVIHQADHRFVVQEGASYWIETEAKTGAGSCSAGFYLRLNFYDAAGVSLATVSGIENVGLTTSWQVRQTKVTAPATAAYAAVRLWNNGSNTTVADFIIDRVVVRRANAASLIVDGTLVASHFSSGEIITGTAQIRDAIITDAKIADLSAAKLTAGTALAGSITVNGSALTEVSQGTRGGPLNIGFTDDELAGWAAGSGTLSQNTTSLSGKSGLVTYTGASDPSSSGVTGGAYYVMPKSVSLAHSGKRVRVTVMAQQPTSGAAAEFAVAYSTNQVGNSGWQRFTPTTGWIAYSFFYDVPSNNTVASVIGIWGDTSNAGLGVLIDSVIVEASAEDYAADPAARINAASTQIDPGKITVSGATTLADWRMGGDETSINGGKISANTISANKLEIGSRAVTTTTKFEHNSPVANSISWTAAEVRYINDAGVAAVVSIAAGNAAWTSGILYVYWVKGATTLSSTTVQATAMAADNVVLATYGGGTKMTTDYGRTVVDGSNIKTGTVTADRLVTGTITAASGVIASAAITTANIANAAITGAKIGDAVITSAKIANSIQSTNFAAGSAGWQITKAGAAEFNSLVVRQNMLQTGSTVAHASVSADTTIISHGTSSVSTALGYTSANNTIELVMMSIDLTSTGARVVVEADFFWEYIYTPTTPQTSNSPTPGTLLLRRKTGTVWTTIRTLVLPTNLGDGRDFGQMSVKASDLPAAGTHTFALTFQKLQEGAALYRYSPTLQLKSRFIGATEYRQAT